MPNAAVWRAAHGRVCSSTVLQDDRAFKRGRAARESVGLKLFKDYAVLAGGQLASKAFAFVAFAWLARVLDPEGYGAVEYVVGLSVLCAVVVDGGFGVIGVRRAAADPSALPRLVFQIPIARMILTAVGVPVMVLMAMSAAKSHVSAGLAWLFALSLLFAPWRQDWLFQATERMVDVVIAQLIRSGIFAVLVWLLVIRQTDLSAVGWAEVGAAMAMTAYCMYRQHVHISRIRLRGSMRGFGELVKEGTLVGLSNVVLAMNQYAPLLMIATLVGGAQTAWFAAALRVIGSLLIFGYVYHFSLYPVVSRAIARKDGDLSRLLAGSCRVTAWGGVFVALTLTLLAEPLMVLAMGEKMAPAAPMLKVMAWILPVAFCSGHARWALAAAGAQAQVLSAQLSGLIATIVVALLLSPSAQGMGFSTAALVGFIVVWVVSHRFAARSGSQPPPFSLALKPTLLAAAIVAGTQFLGSGAWLAVAGLVLFVGAAPLLDGKLVAAFWLLGRAKLDLDSARQG